MLEVPLGIIAAVVFVVLFAAPWIGHRFGRSSRARSADAAGPAQRAGETSGAALLALLGLLLAFSFSLAVQHGDGRRVAVIEEVAAIGTAFLRADLLAEPGRTELQTALRDYAVTRQVRGAGISSHAELEAFIARSLEAQARLWPVAMEAAGGDTPAPVRTYVASGVTEVLDAHLRRYAAGNRAMPQVARFMILGVAAAALVIVGNTAGLQGRPLTWRTFVFAAALTFLIVLLFDIERSYEGFVQSDVTMIDDLVADLSARVAGD